MRSVKFGLISALTGVLLIAPAAAVDRGAAILSAVVAADGTLARGAGAVSATRASVGSTGTYYVTFNRNIDDCVVVVTIGGTAADAQSGSYAQATVLIG